MNKLKILLVLVLFGIVRTSNAQSDCSKYLQENTGTAAAVIPDDCDCNSCDYGGGLKEYMKCKCEEEKKSKEKHHWTEQQIKENRTNLDEINNQFNQLYKEANAIHSKLIREKDISDFDSQKSKALSLYQQAIGKAKEYQNQTVTHINTIEKRVTSVNQDIVRRGKEKIEMTQSEIDNLKNVKPTVSASLSISTTGEDKDKFNEFEKGANTSFELGQSINQNETRLEEMRRNRQTNTEEYRELYERTKMLKKAVYMKPNRPTEMDRLNDATSEAQEQLNEWNKRQQDRIGAKYKKEQDEIDAIVISDRVRKNEYQAKRSSEINQKLRADKELASKEEQLHNKVSNLSSEEKTEREKAKQIALQDAYKHIYEANCPMTACDNGKIETKEKSTCNHCKGKGKTTTFVKGNYTNPNGSYHTMLCGYCDGTGVIWETISHSCSYCDGDGKVYTYDGDFAFTKSEIEEYARNNYSKIENYKGTREDKVNKKMIENVRKKASELKPSGIKWLSLEEAIKESKKSNKNILIYFYSDVCKGVLGGPCYFLVKNVLSKNDIQELIYENFLPVTLDYEGNYKIELNNNIYSNPNYDYYKLGEPELVHQFPKSLGVKNHNFPFFAIVNSNLELIKLKDTNKREEFIDFLNNNKK